MKISFNFTFILNILILASITFTILLFPLNVLGKSDSTNIKEVFPVSSFHILPNNVSAEDPQIVALRQQIWENLNRIPGTSRDYESIVRLRIGNGNIVDRDCKLYFPESSWMIASIIVDDYKAVIKNTNLQIFSVIYRLLVDENIKINEITFSGLWRPWLGSHVHIQGRGIDIKSIKSELGSGVIFDIGISQSENEFGKLVRENLTNNYPVVNQYLSPWHICSPTTNTCAQNRGESNIEKIHRDHLHLTLRP